MWRYLAVDLRTCRGACVWFLVVHLSPDFFDLGGHSNMAPQILPFRDVNLHASPSHYAFTSPSSPQAPALVVDRPTGDLRLSEGLSVSGTKRISSIAGILGIVKLKLGNYGCPRY